MYSDSKESYFLKIIITLIAISLAIMQGLSMYSNFSQKKSLAYEVMQMSESKNYVSDNVLIESKLKDNDSKYIQKFGNTINISNAFLNGAPNKVEDISNAGGSIKHISSNVDNAIIYLFPYKKSKLYNEYVTDVIEETYIPFMWGCVISGIKKAQLPEGCYIIE
mgnify:CR=1 FL=1